MTHSTHSEPARESDPFGGGPENWSLADYNPYADYTQADWDAREQWDNEQDVLADVPF